MTTYVEYDPAIEARMGGRAITRALVAKAAEVRGQVADPYVMVGGCYDYNATTSVLRVVTDDRRVEKYDLEPFTGWLQAAYAERIRVRFTIRSSVTLAKAESMFDWPIYRAAMVPVVGECAWCGKPVFADQEYDTHADGDGWVQHADHYEEEE